MTAMQTSSLSVSDSIKASPGFALFESGVVPPLPVQLSIAFSSSVHVAWGNTIAQSDCRSFPTVNFVDFSAPSEARYSLVLCDPDAPNATTPTSRAFLHLVKPNLATIPVERLEELAASSDSSTSTPSSSVVVPEEDLMPWMPPSPGPGSGKHRYAFVLIRQPKELSFPADHPLRDPSVPSRRHFNVEKFAAEIRGEIVGANWFVVEGAAA